jgi:hypothetical protein
VVGALPVGPGRLVACLFHLAAPAAAADPAAVAILPICSAGLLDDR